MKTTFSLPQIINQTTFLENVDAMIRVIILNIGIPKYYYYIIIIYIMIRA